jgi:MerR family redox-sensitive transcriptional activator SoxR
VRAGREIGLSIDEIRGSLASLPPDRTPTKADWARLSRSWRHHLDTRIDYLERLRDDLTSCIGCGCLSLTTCRLQNRDDDLARTGNGARLLLPGG